MVDGAPLQSFDTPVPPLVAMGGAPLYVTGEDALAVTVFNAAAGVTVTVTGRILQFGQRRATPFAQTIVPATDRSASVARFTLGDGWLLNAEALVSVGTPAIGQTFVRLSLVRGVTPNAADLFTLASDYVTAKLPLSYPGSGVTKSVDGGGALRSITGAVPAAGAEVSETVPTGARWELLAFTLSLTTNATVANRLPALAFDDGTNQYGKFNIGQFVPASTFITGSWGQGLNRFTDISVASLVSGYGVNMRHAAGHRLRTSTLAIQPGDQYSAIQYLVREWIEGA